MRGETHAPKAIVGIPMSTMSAPLSGPRDSSQSHRAAPQQRRVRNGNGHTRETLMDLEPFRLQTRDDGLGKITETLFSEVCFHGSVRDGGAKKRPRLNPSAPFVNSPLIRFLSSLPGRLRS